MSGHAVKDECEVFGADGKGSRLVEAGGVGNHAPAREGAVGRLDAGDAAPGGGLADGAAGVGAGGVGYEAGGNDRSGCAGGATGDVFVLPRVFHRAEGAAFVGGAHGEFVHRDFAGHDSASGGEVFDDARVVGRDEVFQHF